MKSFAQLFQARLVAFAAFGLGGCLLASTVYASLDLSPQQETFDLDGIKISQLAFNTGEKTNSLI